MSSVLRSTHAELVSEGPLSLKLAARHLGLTFAPPQPLPQGAPGTGKTTLLRDIAHLLSDTFQCVLGSGASVWPFMAPSAHASALGWWGCVCCHTIASPTIPSTPSPAPPPLATSGPLHPQSNVVVVDTSNEVAGDASVPHPCIGGARRMMVRDKRLQHDTMVEATANHNPDVRRAVEISLFHGGKERTHGVARARMVSGCSSPGTEWWREGMAVCFPMRSCPLSTGGDHR